MKPLKPKRPPLLAKGRISAAKMNRPAMTDGRPLMASTKIRTGRRHLASRLVQEHGGGEAERQRPQQRQADLLERADHGVGAAAGRGRHHRGDAGLVVREEVARSALRPLTTT